MKFSQETLAILSNFAQINPSIVFNPGNVISTMSNMETVIAKAKVDTEFEETFGIFNLSQFLSVISMFDDPEFTILGSHLQIKSGNEKVLYTLSEPKLITQAPNKELTLPEGDVSFTLEAEVLKKLLKVASLMGSPEIAVTGDRENIYVEALNVKNSSDNNYKVKVGETTSEFKVIFDTKDILVIPDTYQVDIVKKGISKFESDSITYFIAISKSSSFAD